MRGIELARGYFEEYGRPMIRAEFPDIEPLLAVGLVGSGSECFGFDDSSSTDHDFEPGFCIFIPGEDVIGRRAAFLLERAYAKLPREYGGFRRLSVNPVGGSRHGVIRTTDFYARRIGSGVGRLSLSQWMSIPEYALAEAVNGEVFCDPLGEFSAIRERLSEYPADVRLKKLAGNLLEMEQAGQYNYSRCLAHGETAAAQLAIFEFVRAATNVIFLLNRRYSPYYKWQFRALRSLEKLGDLADTLEHLITTDNGKNSAALKSELIAAVAGAVISELESQSLTGADCRDLGAHARSINDRIGDPWLRSIEISGTV